MRDYKRESTVLVQYENAVEETGFILDILVYFCTADLSPPAFIVGGSVACGGLYITIHQLL